MIDFVVAFPGLAVADFKTESAVFDRNHVTVQITCRTSAVKQGLIAADIVRLNIHCDRETVTLGNEGVRQHESLSGFAVKLERALAVDGDPAGSSRPTAVGPGNGITMDDAFKTGTDTDETSCMGVVVSSGGGGENEAAFGHVKVVGKVRNSA